MFALDIAKVKELHSRYHFSAPLLDAGGVANPTIADYEISKAKARKISFADGAESRVVTIPHSIQTDRYVNQRRPWEFIDKDYLILNPDDGQPFIEDLPKEYPNHFATVILTSVLEHCLNPYEVSDALFDIVRPGGFLFDSVPFIFPIHGTPENDNWRFSPLTLRRIHEQSGFIQIDGGTHVNYSTKDGIGDSNPDNYGAPQAIIASYALCRKPS